MASILPSESVGRNVQAYELPFAYHESSAPSCGSAFAFYGSPLHSDGLRFPAYESPCLAYGLAFPVRGFAFPVHGSPFPVHGCAFPVHGSAFPVHASGFPAPSLPFRVHGLGFPVHGLRFPVHGLGFPVHGLPFGTDSLAFSSDHAAIFRWQPGRFASLWQPKRAPYNCEGWSGKYFSTDAPNHTEPRRLYLEEANARNADCEKHSARWLGGEVKSPRKRPSQNRQIAGWIGLR